MKNNIIRIIVFVIFVLIMMFLTKKDIIVKIHINVDKQINYNDSTYIKDILDFDVNSKNIKLDTRVLGKKTISLSYKENNEVLKYTIEYTVVDKEPPLIIGSSTHTISKGQNFDIVNSMMCGDNYDKKPNCYIEGSYNANKLGTYHLKYVAIDSSNNKSEKEYTLIVINAVKSNNETTATSMPIATIIKENKTDDTMIGIDVSSWQGDIDWKKVKDSGVEFAIIRIGYGYNSKHELVYDSKFKNNLKYAKEAGVKVGLYFYSYATSEEEAKDQAKWIVNSLNGEKLDLPIAFDWESWSKFNNYNISFTDLNDIAGSFIDEIENNNYEGMLYGSCSYLERIWKLDSNKTWLAHYTKKTDYTKDYYIWQLSNTGKVNGISGYVDLDILYKK